MEGSGPRYYRAIQKWVALFFSKMDEFVVYILYSKKNGRNYTGFTSNLIQRIASHNYFGKDSTAKFRPWLVIHVEFFDTKELALKREKYFKAGRGSILKNKIIQDFLAHWANTLP